MRKNENSGSELERITNKVQGEFIGAKYLGCTWAEEELTRIVGRPIAQYDECIDDGVDDDETEDQYVMRACFSDESSRLTIRIYYGDVTREIGYVDVSEN